MIEFVHALETEIVDEAAHAERHRDGLVGGDGAQGALVEMIKVRVRKQDKIDLWQLIKLERRCGQSFRTDGEPRQTNPDTRKKSRVSQNFDAEKIDEHCRMAKPGERDLRIAPL